MNRMRVHTAAVALALAGTPLSAAATSESGGSGLIRIGQAYSLPAGRPLIGIYAGYYTSSASGSERIFTLTPSATFGLGSGFEAAGSLPLQGATLALNGDPFDRRFDVSYRDIIGRIRWTGPLRTTRFRGGLEGTVSAPLGGRTRPGGDVSPSNAFDPGLTGLLSTNIGTFDFPIRVHLNAGWWWSRNDGAFYYRSLPGSVAVPGSQNAVGNDVGWAGVGAEVGLRRATLLFEVVTEQFPQARGQIHSSESLWLLTAGFRTALTPSVGLTGGLSLDLSSDDDATGFDPDAVFPDAEIRVGITLGSVLSRDQYETRKRNEAADRKSQAAARAAPSSEPVPAPAQAREPAFLAADSVPGAPAPTAPGESVRLGELEQRIRELEAEVRIQSLETRLRMLELERTGPAQAVLHTTAPTATTAPVPAPAPGAPVDTTLMGRVTDLQRSLQASRTPTTDSASTAVESNPAAADSTPAAADTTPVAADSTPAVAGSGPAVASSAPAAADKPPDAAQAIQEIAPPAPAPAAWSPVATATPPAAALPPSPAPVSPTVTVVDNTPAAPGMDWMSAAPPVPSPSRSLEGAAAPPAAEPDPGVVPLDELLRQYQERMAAPLPTPAPATDASTPAQSPGEEATQPVAPIESASGVASGFPLEVGERRTVQEIDALSMTPLADQPAREAMDQLAAALAAHTDVAIAVTVYGSGSDRDEALALTEQRAQSVRDYLVVAGVAPAQVRALGMGIDPDGVARVEVERLR